MEHLNQDVAWLLQQLGAGVLSLLALGGLLLLVDVLDRVLYPRRPKK